jgi:hypothetical protein
MLDKHSAECFAVPFRLKNSPKGVKRPLLAVFLSASGWQSRIFCCQATVVGANVMARKISDGAAHLELAQIVVWLNEPLKIAEARPNLRCRKPSNICSRLKGNIANISLSPMALGSGEYKKKNTA